jgi:hypothetical protein
MHAPPAPGSRRRERRCASEPHYAGRGRHRAARALASAGGKSRARFNIIASYAKCAHSFARSLGARTASALRPRALRVRIRSDYVWRPRPPRTSARVPRTLACNSKQARPRARARRRDVSVTPLRGQNGLRAPAHPRVGCVRARRPAPVRPRVAGAPQRQKPTSRTRSCENALPRKSGPNDGLESRRERG